MKQIIYSVLFIALFFSLRYSCASQESGWVEKSGYYEQISKFSPVTFLRISKDKQHFWTFHQDFHLRKWNIESGEVVLDKVIPYQSIQSFDLNNAEDKYILGYMYSSKSDLIHFFTDTVLCTINSMKDYPPSTFTMQMNNIYSFFFPNDSNIHTFQNYTKSVFDRFRQSSGWTMRWDINQCASVWSDDYTQVINYEKNKINMILLKVSSYYFSNTNPSSPPSSGSLHSLYLHNSNFSNTINLKIYPESFCFFKNDNFISAITNSKFHIYDITNNTLDSFLINHLSTLKNPTSMKAIPGSDLIIVGSNATFIDSATNRTDAMLSVWDLDSRSMLDSLIFPGIGLSWRLEALPDSSGVIAVASDSLIRIYKPKMLNGQLCARFGAYPRVIFEDDTVNFISNASGAPDSYFWDFGDGETSPERNPVHVYKSFGLFKVKFVVKKGMETDSIVYSDFIRVNPKMSVDFEADITEGFIPFEVQFTNKSQNGNVSQTWDFGDNTKSTLKDPKHTYTLEGVFNVTLTVSNGYFTKSLTKPIFIKGKRPPVEEIELEWEFTRPNGITYCHGLSGIETSQGDFIIAGNAMYNSKELPGYNRYFRFRFKNNDELIWVKEAPMYNDKYIFPKELDEVDIYLLGICPSKYQTLSLNKLQSNGDFDSTYCYLANQNNAYSPFHWVLAPDKSIKILAKYNNSNTFSLIQVSDKLVIENNVNISSNVPSGFDHAKIYNYKSRDNDNLFLILASSETAQYSTLTIVNSDCTPLNQFVVKSKNYMIGKDLVSNNSGDIIICGSVKIANFSHGAIFKINKEGEVIWEYTSPDTGTVYHSITKYQSIYVLAGEHGGCHTQIAIDDDGSILFNKTFLNRKGTIREISEISNGYLLLVGNLLVNGQLNFYAAKIGIQPYDSLSNLVKGQYPKIEDKSQLIEYIYSYPNPSNSSINFYHVSENDNPAIVTIYDIFGSVYAKWNQDSQNQKFSFTIYPNEIGLAPGLYFIILQTKDKSVSGKFIYLTE